MDAEIDTLARFNSMLDSLTPEARYRVLLFTTIRFNLDHERHVARLNASASETRQKAPQLQAVAPVPPTEPGELIPVQEAARLLKYSRQTIYAAIKSNELTTETIKGRMFIRRGVLAAFSAKKNKTVS